MNREERRILERKLVAGGYSKKAASAYVKIMNDVKADHTDAQDVHEGDKIALNIKAIKARNRFEYMNENYKAFIDESEGRVFTAHVEHKNMVSCKEEPRWLFWSGDVVVLERIKENAE